MYEQGGQYQLYVDGLRAAGEGLLYQEFLRLKTELEAEGLFDEARKRSLPRYPRLIGIVTSPTGAALQGHAQHPARGATRWPRSCWPLPRCRAMMPRLKLCMPSKRSIAWFKPDVILVARGGGSLEDLWAFNDERVVRAVAASQAPVISGVGHETDFTLADFAADLRAPTPTGAAVLAVPNVSDLAAELNGWTLRLQQNVLEVLSRSSMALNEKAHRLERQSPLWQVRQDRQYLDGLSQRLQLHINHHLKNRRSTLAYFSERLTGLDPAHILKRGYALVKDSAGSLITSAKQVKLGQDIAVQLSGRYVGCPCAASETRRRMIDRITDG